MTPLRRVTRREAIQVLVGTAAYGFASRPLMAANALNFNVLAADRYSQHTDTKTNTLIIEGLDFVLDQNFIPGTQNILIRGDHITLSGALSLPGFDITILASQLSCVSAASISTVGKLGNPDDSGQVAAPGTDATDAGPGGKGGQIRIVVGSISGDLQLDASGGTGGGAQSGGIGLVGSVGTPADISHPGGKGGPGHIGGRAGTPGAGGNGGSISVLSLDGATGATINAKSVGGQPGKPGTNGKSGDGGPGGPGANGSYNKPYTCPPSKAK